MDIYSTAITLFLVMDPMGNIPIFFSLLKQIDAKRRIHVILRENFIAFGVLTLFLFCGKKILNGLNIREEALGIAGGIILFFVAIKMVFPSAVRRTSDNQFGEPYIVPMAIPLIAGPSVMSTVIVFASQFPTHKAHLFIAISIASLASTLILLAANSLQKFLSPRIISAFERLMGMILTTIAVQMFLTGWMAYTRHG